MNKSDIKTREDAIEYMEGITMKIKELEDIEYNFLDKDLEFLAAAVKDEREKLLGLAVNPLDYPPREQQASVDEGENSLRFRVHELLEEGKSREGATLVADYVVDALGDMGPDCDGLRNFPQLLTNVLALIFKRFIPNAGCCPR